ncbi:MAG: hypothetical protein K6G51_01635 [Sphaerochaetaceae bacterium]|nr:hypothetical protein [Sphaerochaetaceae bacterium]
MKLLLVNDDGYNKGGLPALIKVLEERGHEVWVSAPDGNRSAFSHSMNLTKPIVFTAFGKNKYYCSGTPSDCVLYSIRGNIFPSLPDLIISGINNGPNCSTDISYSGTCAAAREAIYQHVPAIALSQGTPGQFDDKYDYESCANWVADNLDKLKELTSLESFVNINFPNPFSEEVELGSIGFVKYPVGANIIKIDDNSFMMELKGEGEFGIDMKGRGKGDLELVHEGKIAINVISSLPALDEEMMKKARGLFS